MRHSTYTSKTALHPNLIIKLHLEQISKKEETIQKMMKRDVNIELMRRKVSLVENELKLLKKENLELQERYNNLKQKKINNENIDSKKIVDLPYKN